LRCSRENRGERLNLAALQGFPNEVMLRLLLIFIAGADVSAEHDERRA
jgi:hypothetical protein